MCIKQLIKLMSLTLNVTCSEHASQTNLFCVKQVVELASQINALHDMKLDNLISELI